MSLLLSLLLLLDVPVIFGWPVVPPQVVRRVDLPSEPWLPGHRGVDLAAPPGAEVHATGAGTVTFAGLVAGRGVVSVTHPGGLRSTYEPVTATVRTGDVVSAGQSLVSWRPAIPVARPQPACTGGSAAASNIWIRSPCLASAGCAYYRCSACSSGGRSSARRSYSSGRL
jgi:hypothetical protein